MRFLKNFLSGFLCGILLFGFFYVRSCSQYREARKEWEVKVSDLNRDLSDLQVKFDKSISDARYWKSEADKKEIKINLVETELEELKAAHAEVLAGVATLTPDEVVSGLLSVLELPDSEIILTSNGVVFSLNASSLVLSFLYDYKFLKDQENPRLKGIILDQKAEIHALNKANSNLGEAIIELDKQNTILDQKYEGEHKLRIKAESVAGFNIFTTKNVVIAVGVVVVIVGALTLVK